MVRDAEDTPKTEESVKQTEVVETKKENGAITASAPVTASKSSSKAQRWSVSLAIMAVGGRFFPLFPGFLVLQQKL